MELKRKPFQGIFNIIRFNWHFYMLAGLVVFSIFIFNFCLPEQFRAFAFWFAVLLSLSIAVSLIISYYVYDLSDLYQLKWFSDSGKKSIINVNAGFDETSQIIKRKSPESDITICDFYDPQKHTEVSIKRARKAYPLPDNSVQVSTDKLPFTENSFDYSFAILSAHEIRDQKERIDFFKEINRVTKPQGKIFVTEHLRDLSNFLAYTIGFLHFHSKDNWLQTFEEADLSVRQEIKTTPFVTTFILEKNGDTI